MGKGSLGVVLLILVVASLAAAFFFLNKGGTASSRKDLSGEKVDSERSGLRPDEESFRQASPASLKGDEEASFSASPSASVSPGELVIQTLRPGGGLGAKNGESIAVHYTGTLVDGKKFDSSRDRGEPFVFTLGVGQVIKGWDLGISGMKVGEVRKLTIPAALGYGERGTPGGPIPPNAVLVFEIELLKIN